MSDFLNDEPALHERECVPCRGGIPAMESMEIEEYYTKLGGRFSGWKVIEDHHLQKVFTFHDYASSVAYTNRIAELAERVDHHPALLLEWGKVTVTIWTHKVDGLTQSDFVFAAKADKEQAPESL